MQQLSCRLAQVNKKLLLHSVHGISWELCERAKQASLNAVRNGFPASFPSGLPCGNVSYAGPDKSYNHVVSLEAGAHTLWTGIMAEVRRDFFVMFLHCRSGLA